MANGRKERKDSEKGRKERWGERKAEGKIRIEVKWRWKDGQASEGRKRGEKKRKDIQTEGNKTWGREGRREKRRT